MKKLILTLALNIIAFALFSQGEWVWLTGDTSLNSPGNYGTKGVPSYTHYPKAGYAGTEWTDTSGNFWYINSQSGLADLWKYDIDDTTWTWVKGTGVFQNGPIYGTLGVPDTANSPGRIINNNGTGWTDKFNNLWLYRGQMWRYNIATNEWTWMHGPQGVSASVYGTKNVSAPTNNPGYRDETTCTWVDKDDIFWLFGGGKSSNTKNDLWKFDYNTNEWTWVSGYTGSGGNPVHGNKNVPTATNNPGGRYPYASWYDEPSHSLYFFGGRSLSGSMADLWKFDINTSLWTWVSGSNVLAATAVNGTQCTPNANNYPAARLENKVNWKDDCGNFWMFGGYLGVDGPFNDLWRYNIASNEWVWVQGSPTGSVAYNYGVKGVPNSTNFPPGAYGQSSAHSKKGFVIYGSPARNSSALMQYIPDPPIADFAYSTTDTCGKIFFSNNSIAGCNNMKEYSWDFGDGNQSTDENPTHQYLTNGNYNVTLIATNCTWQKDTTSITLNINNVHTIINGSDTICEGDSALIAGEYQSVSGNYFDTTAYSNNCDSVYIITLVVNDCANDSTIITPGGSGDTLVLFVPNIFSPNNDGNNDILFVRGKGVKSISFSVFDRWGTKVFETNDVATGWDGKFRSKKAVIGVYAYVLNATLMDDSIVKQQGNVTLIR